jgi:hypothetical protein
LPNATVNALAARTLPDKLREHAIKGSTGSMGKTNILLLALRLVAIVYS